MPGHLVKARHAPRVAASATAAVIAMTLSACTSTAAGAGAAKSSAAASTASAFTITGAGSTFDAPFFSLAFARYHQQHPAVTINYSAVGSSAGIAAFTAQKVNFGASDVPLTSSEQAAASGGPTVQVPVGLGAEVVAYNLGLPGPSRLHLTGPVIAKIFLGQITHWDNPANWLTHTGQAYAAATSYVPLPSQIQDLAHTALQQITGPNGTHLLS
jgi:phosphate transport system substrate-binding protein